MYSIYTRKQQPANTALRVFKKDMEKKWRVVSPRSLLNLDFCQRGSCHGLSIPTPKTDVVLQASIVCFRNLHFLFLGSFFVSNVHIMYSSIINLSLYLQYPSNDPSGTSLLSRWRHLALTNCGCLEALGNNCNPSNMALVQPICCMVSSAWKPRISRGRRGKKPRTSEGFFCISSANLNLNKIHIKGIMRLHLMSFMRLVSVSDRACQWFFKDLEIRSVYMWVECFGQIVYTLASSPSIFWTLIDGWLPRHQGLRTPPFNLRQQLSH